MSQISKRNKELQQRQEALRHTAESVEAKRRRMLIQPLPSENVTNRNNVNHFMATNEPDITVETLERVKLAASLRGGFCLSEYTGNKISPDDYKKFKIARSTGGWLLRQAFLRVSYMSNTCMGEYPNAEPTIQTFKEDLILTADGTFIKRADRLTPFAAPKPTFGVMEGVGTDVGTVFPITAESQDEVFRFFGNYSREASRNQLSNFFAQGIGFGPSLLDLDL